MILGKQVKDVVANKDVLKESEYPTIYQRLLDESNYKDGNKVPDATALYEEAQTMMFAGGVTVGDTLMTGTYHIVADPGLYLRLKDEVRGVWGDVGKAPSLEILEALPLLTATIKESLRVAPGACSPLLRVVPSSGTVISGASIPGGTVVGMSSTLVHQSTTIFQDPETFDPERWVGAESKGLEQWLVAFSKGPRSCLGLNLAWCELYIAFATMLRRFEMRLDGTTREDLKWRDCFTPYYPGRHLRVWCEPAFD